MANVLTLGRVRPMASGQIVGETHVWVQLGVRNPDFIVMSIESVFEWAWMQDKLR